MVCDRLLELEGRVEYLLGKFVETSAGIASGIIQSVNLGYAKDIGEINGNRQLSCFDKAEIAVRSAIINTAIAAAGYCYLAYDWLRRALK